jgi:MSHA biogenesis protein MshO
MATRQHGFTLVEMVVAITVAAIVVGFMSLFLVAPVDAYLAQERRTEVADSANNARRMLANDIRNALPDNVRIANVGTSRALELLQVTHVAHYRPTGSTGNAPEELALGPPGDQDFTLLGSFGSLPTSTEFCYGYLVVGQGNAYAFANVITPSGSCFTLGVADPLTNEQSMHIRTAFAFAATGSPSRSVFFVSQPVSYVCDLTAGTLKRFDNYPISANQTTHATEAQLLGQGARMSLIARDVTACTFQYSTTAMHGPLARLRMTFSRNGEMLQVFDEVRVENLP